MFNQVENDIGFYYYNCYHFTFLIKKVTDSIFVEILMVFIIILVSKDGNHQPGKNLYPDIEALSNFYLRSSQTGLQFSFSEYLYSNSPQPDKDVLVLFCVLAKSQAAAERLLYCLLHTVSLPLTIFP